MGIRKTVTLLILGVLLFSNSPIAAQTTQTEKAPVQVLVPLPAIMVVPAAEESSATQVAPAPTELKVATEVEIRPGDGTMKVTTKDGSAPTETVLGKPTIGEELVKIAPSPDLPTSKAVVIKQTPGGALEIEVEEVSALTTLPVKVVENEIEVEVGDEWETIILPSEVEILVKDVSPSPTEVKKMELVECKPTLGPEQDCQAVYKTEVERKTSFLGVVEVNPTLKYEVDAVSGQVLNEEKPWYLRLLPFLFK